jgi:hypothetical protein
VGNAFPTPTHFSALFSYTPDMALWQRTITCLQMQRCILILFYLMLLIGLFFLTLLISSLQVCVCMFLPIICSLFQFSLLIAASLKSIQSLITLRTKIKMFNVLEAFIDLAHDHLSKGQSPLLSMLISAFLLQWSFKPSMSSCYFYWHKGLCLEFFLPEIFTYLLLAHS